MNIFKSLVYQIGIAGYFLWSSLRACFGFSIDRKSISVGQIVMQVYEIGILALPIVILLNAAVGLMLSMQGIATLEVFGAGVSTIKSNP